MVSVQRSLAAVDGVTKAEVSLATREAIVTFDDGKTTVEALIEATRSAGYPSSIKREPE